MKRTVKRNKTKQGTDTHTRAKRTRAGPGGPSTKDSDAGLRTSGVAKRAARLNAAEAFMHGARILEHGAADYAARMMWEEVAAGVMVRGAVATGG